MNVITSKRALVTAMVVAGSVFLSGCTSTAESTAPEYSPEGMKLVKSTKATRIYKAKDADFSQYDKILVIEGDVAFKKGWQEERNKKINRKSAAKITDDYIIKTKEQVKGLLTKTFTQEFSKDSNYQVIDKPETNALILRPSIIDLDVNAPDLDNAQRTNSYTRSAGEATLYLEIYDGVTGQILARIMDAEQIGNAGFWQATDRSMNNRKAEVTVSSWAKKLRVQFDKAHNQ